jgi:hypothetical protein
MYPRQDSAMYKSPEPTVYEDSNIDTVNIDKNSILDQDQRETVMSVIKNRRATSKFYGSSGQEDDGKQWATNTFSMTLNNQ